MWGVGAKPQCLVLLKEYFERVWEWFYDRKALPTLKTFNIVNFSIGFYMVAGVFPAALFSI